MKAIRELSSRTDANIANTRRELISQMVKAHQELDSEVAQHRREINSKVARTQRELDSKIDQHHRELEPEMASNHQEQAEKLKNMYWFVRITFLLSLVCIKYLQASSNLMLISTSGHFLEWGTPHTTDLTLLRTCTRELL